MLSVAARTVLLFLLILLLRTLLLFQHRVEVSSRSHGKTRPQPARAALVTLADRYFAPCAVSLLRDARAVGGWRHPIILLTVDYESFRQTDIDSLEGLGVVILHTHAIFDEWLSRGVENVDIFRTLQKEKFRKMELFLSPILRAYERIVYIDADGVIAASLDPLLHVEFPDPVSVLMRQNDVSLGKSRLWGNEMAVEVLTDEQLQKLATRFPNRVKTGGSCWFIVDMRKLPSPARMLEQSFELLCSFRAGFRFNDQTLMSLLFYDSIALFPWCAWDEVPILDNPRELKAYCRESMHLQRSLMGGLRFMYRHMSIAEKQGCVLGESVERSTMPGQYAPGNSSETLDEHRVNEEADCMTALEQWRKRLPVG